MDYQSFSNYAKMVGDEAEKGDSMSKTVKGSLMVLLAGIAWGISGVSGQYLMAHGMDVHLLTSLRLMISGVVLTALVLWRHKEKVIALVTTKNISRNS
ncbi:drug/metabolite transporter superfamily protein [Streptococcus dysgalactiae subsp. equisimilis]|nr:drug/metabolite transporter superfamily protein [Streptococcus dysgalactiae subsp. equisimilis]